MPMREGNTVRRRIACVLAAALWFAMRSGAGGSYSFGPARMAGRRNSIEALEESVRKRHPRHSVYLDRPDDSAGSWFLDIISWKDASRITVEWRPGVGFGLSAVHSEDPRTGFMERPEEVYDSLEDVQKRIDRLLGGAERALP